MSTPTVKSICKFSTRGIQFIFQSVHKHPILLFKGSNFCKACNKSEEINLVEYLNYNYVQKTKQNETNIIAVFRHHNFEAISTTARKSPHFL